MPKTVSDKLFLLIRSLTKQEKRYFKLYSSLHTVGEQNNYVLLFDAIDKQEAYDEGAIKKKFQKQAFVKQLHVTKNRLHEAILNSLHAYHLDLTTDSKLKKQLVQANILFHKGLYDQCAELLDRTIKTALELEKFTSALDVYACRTKLFAIGYYDDIIETELSKFYEEEREVISNISTETYYKFLQGKIGMLRIRSTRVRDKQLKEKYNAIILDPFLTDARKASTFYSKLLFYHLRSMYHYYAESDYKKVYEYDKKSFELLHALPAQIKDNPRLYLATLNNFMITCCNQGKHSETTELIQKMKTISADYSVKLDVMSEVNIFTQTSITELDICLATCKFENLKKLFTDIESGLVEFGAKIPNQNKRALLAIVSYLHFITGEYKTTLKWLNKMLEPGEFEMREDLVSYSKILLLLVHFELGNTDLIPYLTRSTYRFLKKRQRLYKVEEVIVNFLGKKLSSPHERSSVIRDDFYTLQSQIKNVIKDPLEKRILHYFDWISWLESKITDRPFADILKEKMNKEKVSEPGSFS